MSITNIGHYIGGQVAAGASGRSQPVTNPATGAVTGNVALANSAEVAKAVAAAQAAFPAWSDMPPLRLPWRQKLEAISRLSKALLTMIDGKTAEAGA